MDIEEKKSYPKFIGVLLALFVPGMAHFLSGKRKVGIILLALSYFVPVIGLWIAVIPSKAAILFGLSLLSVVTPLLALYILATSWRGINHMPSRHWIGVIASVIVLSFIKGSLNSVLPFRPHKIPAGAMQPTIMGIHTLDEMEDTHFIDRMLFGKYGEKVVAFDSGEVTIGERQGEGFSLNIGESNHWLPDYATKDGLKPSYEEGQTIWSGTVFLGDFVLTDKLAYAFSEPERGDIITFSTKDIEHESVRRNTMYIKRIVGLPGETISIKNGKVIANGAPVNAPEIFQTLKYDYSGELSDETHSITLGDDEYLTLGDNAGTGMSLDGRHYGPITRDSILAQAKTIYWPINRISVLK